MIDSSTLVTTRQAAELLDVHESSIKRWCSLDHLSCTQTPGGHRRIPFNGLMEFAKKRDISCPLHVFDGFAGRVWEGFLQAQKTANFSALADLAKLWIQESNIHYLSALLDYLQTQGYEVAVQMDKILAPVMYYVGKAYMDGDLSIGEEHRVTYLMRDVLIRLSSLGNTSAPNNPFKKAVLGCIRSQEHELGCLMARMVLESAGWDVLYLGLDVPTEEFARMQNMHDATMVCIAHMPPTTQSEIVHIVELLDYMYDRKKPYHLVFGGPVKMDITPFKATEYSLASVQQFQSMTEFSDWLNNQEEPEAYANSKDLVKSSLKRSLR